MRDSYFFSSLSDKDDGLYGRGRGDGRGHPRGRRAGASPEIAQYPKSTQMTSVLARGGPVPMQSSQAASPGTRDHFLHPCTISPDHEPFPFMQMRAVWVSRICSTMVGVPHRPLLP